MPLTCIAENKLNVNKSLSILNDIFDNNLKLYYKYDMAT